MATTNAGRAREFYCSQLGLKFVSDDGFAVVVKAGQGAIRIVRTKMFAPQPFTVLGWEVGSIKDEVRRLMDAGISPERFNYLNLDPMGIWTAPDGSKVAWLKDPDGNVLSLSEHP